MQVRMGVDFKKQKTGDGDTIVVVARKKSKPKDDDESVDWEECLGRKGPASAKQAELSTSTDSSDNEKGKKQKWEDKTCEASG